MSSSSKQIANRVACLALALSMAPTQLFAQTLTKVRIGESGTAKMIPNACTAGAPKPIEDKPGQALQTKSQLEVHVQNDLNEDGKSANDLNITVEKQSVKIDKDKSTASLTGDFSGKTLTITQASNGILVCAITIPSVAVDEDTTQRAIRVGIGATFDFLNGISATDLYSDLTVFLPTLWHATNKDGTEKRWAFGIDAGLYNGRTVPRRSDSTIMEPSELTAISRILPRKQLTDSLVRVLQVVRRSSSESVDRLGVYFAPTFRVANGLHVLIQSELVRRDIVTEVKLHVESQDTVQQGPRTTTPLEGTGKLLPPDTTTKARSSEYKAIHTAGVLMNVRVGNIEFRAKPTFGFTFDNAPDAKRHRRGIYTAQFRVTDFQHGFKIGGDVRGLANGDETVFLVYLAKDFGFKRLGSFILGSGEN